jgi:hypothetical protein
VATPGKGLSLEEHASNLQPALFKIRYLQSSANKKARPKPGLYCSELTI